MKIKKISAVCIAILTIAAAAVGCKKEETRPEREAVSSSSEAAEQIPENEYNNPEADDSSKPEKDKKKDNSSSKADSEKETENKNNDSSSNSSEDEKPDDTDSDNADDDTPVGDTGMTVSEWLDNAKGIYDTAAKTRFDYICTSAYFECDYSDMIDGKWVRVTNCDTMEEATAEYYSVFAETGHESDLDNYLVEIDGAIYCSDGARGVDRTYQSTEITELTESSDDTLTFKAVSTYDDRTEESVFSLVFESGVWRVEDFTMPY